ncbi:hypothetical protein QVD17_37946 [Tagetes erecta]|uniref:Uncharacterized protein n=1 Tax=Tagetes erecta TaxID=13708 RepID=A0AAD8JX14_TARER|nr:hypothetical protein QVD17_37946 [Tagetes erecta]
MEHNNITLIKNIHLTNDDLTLKLRIVRLWKLPDHINKKEVYSIEMILMDEEPNFGSVRCHRGQVMSVTLFADYAEKFIEYLQKNPEEVRFIVILQFGRIKWFQGNPAVNTSYNVTKLFINDDIEEIITFKRATDDELFLKTEFINIEEVIDIKEEKHVVILATIISFIEDKPWGYLGCTKCYKKMEPVILIDDKPKSPAEVDEPTIYRCTKCLIDVSDFYTYPPWLTTLLQRKFSFKIEISKFVLDHSLSVYRINKISADDSIISQLNQKVDREQPAESDSQLVTYMFVASQDTTTKKKLDVVSVTDDNVTPASHTEKSTATSPLVRAKNSAVSSTSSDLKSNLSDAYDVDPPTANSTTKKDRSSVSSGQADQIKLLVPKVEK